MDQSHHNFIIPILPIIDIVWYCQKKPRHTLKTSESWKETANEGPSSAISLQLSSHFSTLYTKASLKELKWF